MNFNQMISTAKHKLGSNKLAWSLFTTAVNKFQGEMNEINVTGWENVPLKPTDDFFSIYLNIRQKLILAGKDLKCGIALYDEPICNEIYETLVTLREIIMRNFSAAQLPFLL